MSLTILVSGKMRPLPGHNMNTKHLKSFVQGHRAENRTDHPESPVQLLTEEQDL